MTDAVVYECGCDGVEVGQAFVNGLLVCPLHRQPVAPFLRDEPRWQGQVGLIVDLDVLDDQQAQRWLDTLTDVLERDNSVAGITSTITRTNPVPA